MALPGFSIPGFLSGGTFHLMPLMLDMIKQRRSFFVIPTSQPPMKFGHGPPAAQNGYRRGADANAVRVKAGALFG